MIRCHLCNAAAVFKLVCACDPGETEQEEAKNAHYVCPDCESKALEQGMKTGHCLVCCEGDC